jgi:hypothetical protein
MRNSLLTELKHCKWIYRQVGKKINRDGKNLDFQRAGTLWKPCWVEGGTSRVDLKRRRFFTEHL